MGMNLYDAWQIVKGMCDDYADEVVNYLNDEEKQALKIVETHLDPYLKRICAMHTEHKPPTMAAYAMAKKELEGGK